MSELLHISGSSNLRVAWYNCILVNTLHIKKYFRQIYLPLKVHFNRDRTRRTLYNSFRSSIMNICCVSRRISTAKL